MTVGNDNYIAGKIHYAGFFVRLQATLIDILILLPIFITISFIMFPNIINLKQFNENESSNVSSFLQSGSVTSEDNSANDVDKVQQKDPVITKSEDLKNKRKQNINDLINLLIFITYSIYFLSLPAQATPGKRVMGIIVVSLDNGGKMTPYKAFERSMMSIISSLFLGAGFLMIAFTKEKTALHDLLCNTRVVYTRLYNN